MDHLKLKLSDETAQQRLETVIGQLEWTIAGRSVFEQEDDAPQLGYRLKGPGDADGLLEAIPRLGYGLTKPHILKRVGDKTTLHVTVRQLVPTDTTRQGGLKTFGEAY